MKQQKVFTSKYAVCVNNSEYPSSLEIFKIYRVLKDDDASANGDLRIIDESEEDYIYPADFFIPIEIPGALEKVMLQTHKHNLNTG